MKMFVLISAVLLGCHGRGEPQENNVQLLFDANDADKDGLLSFQEFYPDKIVPDTAKKVFKFLDSNNDGYLSRDEYNKAIDSENKCMDDNKDGVVSDDERLRNSTRCASFVDL